MRRLGSVASEWCTGPASGAIDVAARDIAHRRRKSLLVSHVAGGVLSVLVLASYLISSGNISSPVVLIAMLFASQLGIAAYLGRSGRLETAHLMAAANLAAIVSAAAALTGGTASFAVVWLALVPVEAALSSDRRTMVLASAIALAAFLGLHFATIQGMLPQPMPLRISDTAIVLIGTCGAILYAGAVVAQVQSLHRAAARALEHSHERYRLITENANDLITRHDATGRVTFASLSAATLLGRDAADIVARGGFEHMLTSDSRQRYGEALAACLVDGIASCVELELAAPATRDGRPVVQWLEMRCQIVADGSEAGGHFLNRSLVAVTRDVTERKAEAAALAAARDEAQRASRAKSAFLAVMSHELRTPLSAIIGFSELLHRELLIREREPKNAEYCQIIHQSGEHLLSLVKDLLDMSKIESGRLHVELETVALDELVVEAVKSLRPLADGKGVRLACNLDRELPEVQADRRAVRQIVLNLVSNACKFTQSGGTIAISTVRRGERIELAVADTGIGIPAEHLKRLGEPFYQVNTRYDRNNEGAGLGLSIVRGLIDLHGDTLAIESEVGRGSRFSVSFAIDPDAEMFDAAPVGHRGAAIVDLAEIHARNQARSAAAGQRPAAALA